MKAWLVLVPLAHAGLRDAELEALRDAVLPMVEQAAGRTFADPPPIDARSLGGLTRHADALDRALAPRFHPELGGRAVVAFQRGGRDPERMFLAPVADDGTVVLRSDLGKAWRLRLAALDLRPAADETVTAVAACVLAHGLTHALQAEAGGRAEVLASGDMERLAAWDALAEGHALAVTRTVCAARGTPELAARLERAMGPDGLGPGPEAGEQASVREAGGRFVEAQEDVWAALARPPTDTGMIFHPRRYRPGAEVPVVPASAELRAIAADLVGGRPSLQTGERAGHQALLPLIRRSDAGVTALDGLRAARIQTVAHGVGAVEVLAAELDTPEDARALVGALRQHEAWRLRPDHRWRAAAFAEPPVEAPGPAGGWRSRLTLRPAQGGGTGAVTEVWVSARGRFVVRIWTTRLSLPEDRVAEALDRLLRALEAADP